MKLISLNIWAGREYNALMKYVSDKANDTDIFCFQEVFDTPTSKKIVSEHYRANIFSELQKVLPDHIGYFAPVQDNCGFDGSVDYPIQWGLAMFVRKSLNILDTGEVYIFRSHNDVKKNDNTTIPRNLQYVHFDVNGQDYTIAHFHGLWNGHGKTDTKERIKQSKKVKEFLDKVKVRKIVCGDFNLLPDTESLAILEDGLVNLIKTQGITTTRSPLYQKSEKYADYTFVSSDIKVESFVVPQIEVSDHLPMELQFS